MRFSLLNPEFNGKGVARESSYTRRFNSNSVYLKIGFNELYKYIYKYIYILTRSLIYIYINIYNIDIYRVLIEKYQDDKIRYKYKRFLSGASKEGSLQQEDKLWNNQVPFELKNTLEESLKIQPPHGEKYGDVLWFFGNGGGHFTHVTRTSHFFP